MNRITQALLNLLSNSVQKTEAGRVGCVVQWLHAGSPELNKPSFSAAKFKNFTNKQVTLVLEGLDLNQISQNRASSERIPSEDTHYIKFEIYDTGVGFTKEMIAKLMNPLEVVDEQFGDTGLALWISS